MHAESYGASGIALKPLSELVPLMRVLLREGGVHVIDVPVDYSENDRILNHEIKRTEPSNLARPNMSNDRQLSLLPRQ